MRIDAITLDLDDTLWPIGPVIERADHALQEWLTLHAPEVAAALPIDQMRALRDRTFAMHPELGHDFTALRLLALRAALNPFGYGEAAVEAAYEAFFAARNRVDLYPDSLDALARLSARAPLVALSNGNACLQRIGLSHHFVASISARQHGAAKPDPSIFLAACQAAASLPERTLHVGDHAEQDVLGAMNAGLHAAWLNRHGHAWTHGETAPRSFACLRALADFVDAL